MQSLTAISLFSGCGGFDYGASQAGVKIIWANDIDRHAACAYQSIFPDTEFVLDDVRNVPCFPEADILIGCYPCTGFSIAARRSRKTGEKRDLRNIKGNFLYQEFLRVLGQISPRFFFVENVLGMVSAHKGWFFNQQLKGFEECGYTVYTKLLSAEEYGVSQSRKRVFLVGVRKDISEQYKYNFLPPTHGKTTGVPVVSLWETIGDMPLDPKGEYLERAFHGHYLTRNRKRSWKQPSYTIVAHGSHVPLHPAGEPMVFVGKDHWELQGDFNRRLSWRECARIQGLSDSLHPSGGLMDKYRVVGNAVPPAFGRVLLEPVVRWASKNM